MRYTAMWGIVMQQFGVIRSRRGGGRDKEKQKNNGESHIGEERMAQETKPTENKSGKRC